MSGRCVPPRNGSLRIQASPGLLVAVEHGRDRVGHRAEVDGDVLGLHHQLAAGVEERGRAVAALLDVRRVGRADQHRAHLVAGGAQRADQHLQRDRVEARAHRASLRAARCPRVVDLRAPAGRQHQGRLRAARTRTGPRPRCPAGGSPAQRPRPRATRRRTRARRLAALEGALAGGRAGAAPGRARRAPGGRSTSSTSAVGVAVAVTALVLGARSPRRAARDRALAAGDRELEGLAAVAQLVGDLGAWRRRAPRRERLARARRTSAAMRSAVSSSPRSITVRAVSRRRSEASRPSADSTPLARGQRIRSIPSSAGDRRRVHRPGAAERHQREAARVDAALDRDDAQRARPSRGSRSARCPRRRRAARARARPRAARPRRFAASASSATPPASSDAGPR